MEFTKRSGSVCSPAEELAAVLEQLHGKLEKKQLRLQVETALPPLCVRADANSLRRVFSALIGCAAALSPANGRIALRARTFGSEGARWELRLRCADVSAASLRDILARDGGFAQGIARLRALLALEGGTLRLRGSAGEGLLLIASLPFVPCGADDGADGGDADNDTDRADSGAPGNDGDRADSGDADNDPDGAE